jgi:hypothetical protein
MVAPRLRTSQSTPALADQPLPWLYAYREDAQSTRIDGPVFRPFVPVSLVHGDPPPFTTPVSPLYTGCMATAVKKLDLHVGELVEIDGRRYEVVPDKTGGLMIEPPITPRAELHAKRGSRRATREEFEQFAADLPYDDEG